MTIVVRISLGLSLSISRPLAVNGVSESMAIVSEVSCVSKVSSVSKSVSVVVRISLGLRLSISLPLAIDETIAISYTISHSVVSESSVKQVRIGLSLGEGHSSQGGNNNGFNHFGLFLHLVLGGESPC